MTKQIKDNMRVEIKRLEKKVARHFVNLKTVKYFGDAKVHEIARLNSCKQRLQVLRNIVR